MRYYCMSLAALSPERKQITNYGISKNARLKSWQAPPDTEKPYGGVQTGAPLLSTAT